MKKNCKNTKFQELIDAKVKFCKERNWDASLNDPKSIIMAMMTELGELSELYSWKEPYYKPETKEEKKKIVYEIVDVFNYLAGLISQFQGEDDPDFCKLVFEKWERLAEKYPVNASDEVHRKNQKLYRQTGKNELYE